MRSIIIMMMKIMMMIVMLKILTGQGIRSDEDRLYVDPRDKDHDQSLSTLSFPDNLQNIFGNLWNQATSGSSSTSKAINRGSDGDGFPWKLANTSIWLSAAAYCPIGTLLRHDYFGYAEGFIPTDLINTAQYDIQGFLGYLPAQETIYLVFRGSSSLNDWIDNFHTKAVSYPYCSDCEVHNGFYTAEQYVISQIMVVLRALMRRFPTYQIIVTGHSLGAALATLTAIDLVQNLPSLVSSHSKTGGGSSVTPTIGLINFGSPRIGNLAFATYASKLLESVHFRVTHLRDVVPHMPWFLGYTHLDSEWYEDEMHQMHKCVGYEDINCADQWYITSIDDHLLYLNQSVSCEAVTPGYF